MLYLNIKKLCKIPFPVPALHVQMLYLNWAKPAIRTESFGSTCTNVVFKWLIRRAKKDSRERSTCTNVVFK